MKITKSKANLFFHQSIDCVCVAKYQNMCKKRLHILHDKDMEDLEVKQCNKKKKQKIKRKI